MNRTVLDLWVGFFVAIGIAALLFLALKVGNLSSAHLSDLYVLEAKFDNIGGLKVRGPVKSAGVVVGRIADIRFDTASYEAVVTINVDGRYRFPKDTFASIIPRACSVSSTSGWRSAATRRCWRLGIRSRRRSRRWCWKS